jgi:small subunit ribosomal protein S16
MLSIRMQRLGRKGHPVYRVVVQDSRQSPDSGKYVALLGNYDPHTKTANIVKDKAEFYLNHGAQPSDRVAKLFKSEKVTLPAWVKEPTKHERTTRNPDKLRKNRPAEAPTEQAAPEAVGDDDSSPETETADQQPSEKPAEESAPAEVAEVTEDTPVEEKPAETEEAEKSPEAVESPAETATEEPTDSEEPKA